MERILIIGAAGQIGSELTLELRRIYGNSNVYATDVKDAPLVLQSGEQVVQRRITVTVRIKFQDMKLAPMIISQNLLVLRSLNRAFKTL